MSALAAWNWPETKPLSRPRRLLTVAASKLAGVVLWSLGFSVRVTGREHLKKALKAKGEDRPVLIFNHVSWADAPLVMYLAAASGVSRASNKDIPLIGTCIRAFQNIYVERAGEGGRKKKEEKEKEKKGNGDGGGGDGKEKEKKGVGCSEASSSSASSAPSSSSSGVTAAIQARVRGDPDWPNLILAPEGTCGDGKCLLRFRTGAFVPGAPVLPILLKYENGNFNPAWGIVADERIHFVRALCQIRKRVDVLVLPPYLPSEAEKKDPALFAANVRRVCAEALGVPMRDDQGYEEFAALLKAGVSVSADGRRVVAPAGVVDEATGLADLTRAVRERKGSRKEEEKKDK